MPKVTVTFEGDTLEQAMLRAMAESQEFAKQILSHELQGEEVDAQMKAATKGNGEAKEDVVMSDEAPLENDAILASALDLLMTIYAAKDDPTQTVPAPSTAVAELLEKYGVENLHEVPVERASELFADAKELATVYGVSN